MLWSRAHICSKRIKCSKSMMVPKGVILPKLDWALYLGNLSDSTVLSTGEAGDIAAYQGSSVFSHFCKKSKLRNDFIFYQHWVLVDVVRFCQGRSVGDSVETFSTSHWDDAVVVQQEDGVALWRRPNVNNRWYVAETKCLIANLFCQIRPFKIRTFWHSFLNGLNF